MADEKIKKNEGLIKLLDELSFVKGNFVEGSYLKKLTDYKAQVNKCFKDNKDGFNLFEDDNLESLVNKRFDYIIESFKLSFK